MFSHQPPGYECPFCRLIAGVGSEISGRDDIVLTSPEALALISPRWWPNNHGHVIVVPVEHHESIYDLPNALGHAVHDMVQTIAIAIRETYGCDGVSTRQHNEPSGGQDVWHFHTHVFPRFHDDNLYGSTPYPEFVAPAERRPFAQRLRYHLSGPDGSR